MLIPIALGLITIVSVILALKKKRPFFFALPILALAGTVLIKVIMVPLPFWETITFIFDLR